MMTDKKKTALLGGLLFVSVAANLAFAAFNAGMGERKGHGREPRELAIMRGLQESAQTLPPETRTSIDAVIDAARPEMKTAIEAIGRQRDTVRQLMLQPVPDSKALREAFAELRRRTDAAQAITHETIVAVAPQLPPDLRPMVRRKPPEHKGGKMDAPRPQEKADEQR